MQTLAKLLNKDFLGRTTLNISLPWRILVASGAALGAIFGTTVTQAVVMTGATAATPTSYVVTIREIEFVNSSGTTVSFFSGSQDIDIASVGAGATAAVIGNGRSLPVGNYTTMNVTISGNFRMTGAATNGGQRCRTNSATAVTTTDVAGGITVNTGTAADVLAATEQTIAIPTGGAITLPANLTSLGGGLYRFSTPQSLSITEAAAALPAYTVKFDVTNGIEFLTTGVGTCVVTPVPPTVTVTSG